MNSRWAREADAAYIASFLTEDRAFGVSHDCVTLEDVAEGTGIDALHSLMLRRATVRDSTLRDAE